MTQSIGTGLASKVRRWMDGDYSGDGRSLIRHLALRGDPDAMTELDRLAFDKRRRSTALSAAALVHNAALKGHAPAAYNLAIQRFNEGDLQGYRSWLHRAAQAGDESARRQLHRFETRLPHGVARDIGRGRPYRTDD